MLLATERALALRCLACGRLRAHDFSLFSVSGTTSLDLECPCGSPKASITRRQGALALDCACIACGECHLISIPVKECSGLPWIDIACPRWGVLIGALGEAHRALRRVARGALEEVCWDLERSGYFSQPGAMRAALEAVQAAAELDELRCGCGCDRIEVDVYPDKLELVCMSCRAAAVIDAGSVGEAPGPRLDATGNGYN